MNNRLIMLLLVLQSGLYQLSFSQEQAPDLKKIVAPFKEQKKSKVMILGTFHFNDGGQDAYKPKYRVNIKSAQRQKEVKELLTILARFQPTKVAIESKAQRQPFHDSLYTEFINNRYEPGENEIYQICYRLASMMGHKKLYNIDVMGREFDSYPDVDSFATANHQNKDTTYLKLLFALYAHDDSLVSVLPLRTALAYENNPERLRLGLGHYFTGNFKVAANGVYPGPDEATYWWNRNLRIFANILQLAASSKEERIFVMIGSGHLQILRFLAMACPDIEFVDAYDYLKKNE